MVLYMKLSIKELSEQTNISIRKIRYYMQQKLIPRSHGQNKGAWYSEEHLTALLKIKDWRDAGMSIDAISNLLNTPEESILKPRKIGTIEVHSHYLLADGIELVINPSTANLNQEQLRSLIKSIDIAFKKISNDTQDKKD